MWESAAKVMHGRLRVRTNGSMKEKRRRDAKDGEMQKETRRCCECDQIQVLNRYKGV
jgi:hypothetical protein